MLKKILIGAVVFILILTAVIIMQPADFRISRSLTILTPPSVVFSQVNDFHNWQAWSPWAKLDPAAKYTFEGPSAGTGAIFRWAGNHQVGEGSNTIIESRPNELVKIQLEFIKPFQATNTAEFDIKTQGENTFVTWRMYGKNNFMSKAFGLFMNCDDMVGQQFEKGLNDLKSVAERSR